MLFPCFPAVACILRTVYFLSMAAILVSFFSVELLWW